MSHHVFHTQHISVTCLFVLVFFFIFPLDRILFLFVIQRFPDTSKFYRIFKIFFYFFIYLLLFGIQNLLDTSPYFRSTLSYIYFTFYLFLSVIQILYTLHSIHHRKLFVYIYIYSKYLKYSFIYLFYLSCTEFFRYSSSPTLLIWHFHFLSYFYQHDVSITFFFTLFKNLLFLSHSDFPDTSFFFLLFICHPTFYRVAPSSRCDCCLQAHRCAVALFCTLFSSF